MNCSCLLFVCFVSAETTHSVLTTLVKQTAEVKEQVILNTRMLQEIVKRQRGTDKVSVTQPPCRLPLASYEMILAVEAKLKSKDFYSHMVCLSPFCDDL